MIGEALAQAVDIDAHRRIVGIGLRLAEYGGGYLGLVRGGSV